MREYTVKEYDMEDYEIASNTMTLGDVVNCLSGIDSGWIPDYNFTGTEEDFELYLQHHAMAVAIDIIKAKAESEG